MTQEVRFKSLRGFKPTYLTLSTYQALQSHGKHLAPSTPNFSTLHEPLIRVKGRNTEKHNVLSWEGGHSQSRPHPGHWWRENTNQGSNLSPFVLWLMPELCELLYLLFLLDTTPVLSSERILWVGKDDMSINSITIWINVNFTAFLAFITTVTASPAASLKQTHALAGCRATTEITELICTSSPNSSSTPQTSVIDLLWLCLLQILFLDPLCS